MNRGSFCILLRFLLFLHRCLDAAQGLGAQAEERRDVFLCDDADDGRVLLEEPFVAFLAVLGLGGDLPLDVDIVEVTHILPYKLPNLRVAVHDVDQVGDRKFQSVDVRDGLDIQGVFILDAGRTVTDPARFVAEAHDALVAVVIDDIGAGDSVHEEQNAGHFFSGDPQPVSLFPLNEAGAFRKLLYGTLTLDPHSCPVERSNLLIRHFRHFPNI